MEGIPMGNNKDPKKIRPGEMPDGTFHYNPGNMSGKKIGNAEREKDDVVPVDEGGTPAAVESPKTLP
jgi:hypothetical protein